MPLSKIPAVGVDATGTPSSTTFFRGDNTWATPTAASGSVVQVVNVQTGAFSTSSTIIPIDNTIPQITEGTQLFTLNITPTSASSKLKFDIVVNAGINSANWVSIALFQDSTANALAAMSAYLTTSGSAIPVALNYYMTAGTTSTTTFRLRCGPLGNIMGINGTTSQLLGGVQISSMTITEIAP